MSAARSGVGVVTVNRLVTVYLAVAVGAGLCRLWSPSAAWLLLGLATSAVLAAAPSLYPEEDRPAWFTMAASAAVFTAADVSYAPWAMSRGRLAAALYVPAYVLNAVALRRLTRKAGGSRGFLDAAVLTVGLAVLLVPLLTGRGPRADPWTLAWLYPLAGLMILALSVRLARASPSPSSWLLIAAAAWLLASGVLTAWIGYPLGAWLLQTLRGGFLVCWGLAALWPPRQRSADISEFYRPPPVWLFALVVLLVPGALLVRTMVDSSAREALLAVACAAAGLFVVAQIASAARATVRDPVTGLILLPVLLAEARAMLSAKRTPTLFLVEMRQFHAMREGRGRLGSDEVLRRIGRRLARAAGHALIAKSSSDRFAVLADLSGADGDTGRLAADLIAAVARPLAMGGHRLQIACSIGYATADASSDVDDLMTNTEIALHAARSTKPGASVAYDPRLREAELETAILTADLRAAIDADELFLEYQPIVVLADGVIEGFEALVRWQHPRLGRLSPYRFIPLAESAGLIDDLGAWVLGRAVDGAVSLNTVAGRPVRMHINVSPEQFGPRLTRELRQVLNGCPVDPAVLVLEVTETVLIPDRKWLAGELRELKATGVQVSVDDFGTGYSSLARLKQLPIDGIKIDRMFVTELRPGGPAQMVSGILQIAKGLGLDVVAEGIEQTSERDLLLKLGCRLGQGFLYSRPVGLAEAAAMIKAGPVIR